MGFIFLGIAILAILITGISEYRRRHNNPTRTAFAKSNKTVRIKDESKRGR